MTKGIIVNLKRFRLLNYVSLNKIFILISALFIVGIITGSVLFSKNIFITQNAKLLFEDFISIHTNNVFLKKLFTCYLRYLLILFIYFLFGASMFGVAVTPFITIWQGILIGSITSYIYNQYNLTGIAFSAIILIPPSAIFIVCCFFAAKYSINFSFNIAKQTLPKMRPISLNAIFKNYCIKYLILSGITAICTIIEIILNLLFLKFFNF